MLELCSVTPETSLSTWLSSREGLHTSASPASCTPKSEVPGGLGCPWLCESPACSELSQHISSLFRVVLIFLA